MDFDRSSVIYRSVFAAVIGWLVLVANTSPTNVNSLSNPTIAQGNGQSVEKQDMTVGGSRRGGTVVAQKSKNDPYEKERDGREIRALQAQENSAYWAEAMFWATAAALILSTIGIGLVWITFRETRKSNQIAGDIGFKQLRAYVTIENAKTVDANFADQSVNFQGVRITLHNSGSTPAISVRVTIDKFIIENGEPHQVEETFMVADIGGQARQSLDVPWYSWDDFYNAKADIPKMITGWVSFKTAIPNDVGEMMEFVSAFDIEPSDGHRREAVLVDIVRMPNKFSF